MKLYEIDQALLDLVNPETGEIEDFEQFEALNMVREQKLEHIALWYKNLDAEAKAIREEEKNLAERRQKAEKQAARLKTYLSDTLQGEKLKTSKVNVAWRKSTAVDIKDEEKFIELWNNADYLVPQPPKIDRNQIKADLKKGVVIKGAELIEKNNISIK